MDKEQVFPTQENSQGIIIERDEGGEVIFTESSGDYILPDYLPEIRKILKINARVIPAGKFISGGKAEFAGTVAYTIIYSDGEGHIIASMQNSEYEFSIPIPNDCAGASVCCDTAVDYVSYRLGGPRKISIRTTLKTKAHIICESLCQSDGGSFGDDVEELREAHYSMVTLCSASPEISLSDSALLDGYSADSVKIVYCDGKVFVREARAVAGGVVCRGEVIVKCIYSPEGGTAFSSVKRIPFEETVPVEGAQPTYNAVASGNCLSVDVSMSNGEGSTNVTYDVVFVIDVRCFTNSVINPVADMFSVKCDYDCKYDDLTVCRFGGSVLSNFTLDGSLQDLKGEMPRSIVDTEVKAEIKEVSVENGKAVISGVCTVTVIATVAGDSPNTQYASFEGTVPFRYETDLKASLSSDFEYRIEAVSSRSRIDTKGITFDTELSLWIKTSECSNVRMLESATPVLGSEYEHESGIAVVYPSGKTLWDISKAYKVHPRDITELNGLGNEMLGNPAASYTLDDVNHVLIEK